MPNVNFTARNPFTLPKPAEERIEYYDENVTGLCLRVTSNDARSWSLRYRFKGTLERLSLGKLTNENGIAEARRKAKIALKDIGNGINPAAAKAADRKADTFEQLADLYIEAAKETKRTWRAAANIIKKDLAPAFGRSKATDITRADIRAMLERIKARGASTQVNRTLEVVRRIFSWAIEQDLGGISVNPCQHIKKPSKEKRRENTLSDEQIHLIWNALPQIDPVIANVYRLLFLTGTRKGEIIDMERSTIEGAWLTTPGVRTKNGKPHRVYLTKAARDVIAEMELFNKGGERIFPGGARPKTGLTFAIYDAHEDLMEASGVDGWRIHDIRRTVATKLGSMGFSRFVIGHILNHSDRSVTAIYDQHTYDADKRHALEKWSDRLAEIVSGKPVAGSRPELAVVA